MHHTKKQIFKIAIISIIIFISILAVFTMWLYSGRLTELKINIFNRLPLPIALVNNKALTMRNYTLRWQTYQKLYQEQITTQTSDTAKKAIFSQMVKDEEAIQIASRHGLSVDRKEIEAEYSAQESTAGKGFQEMLKTYGFDPDSYKQYAIKPQLLLIKLQIWFNSQETLNKIQFELAKNLAEQINNGQDMAILAEQFSQDETGRAVGGDMGFLDPTELVVEMREAVYSLAKGEAKIIPSRTGVNIIKLEEKQANMFRLRQIFLQPEDFKPWLDQETKNFKIYKLIDF